MTNAMNHYMLLSELFVYPDKEFANRVRDVQVELDASYPDAAQELRGFTEFVSGASGVVLEELYTRSFDVQAVTTLDIGYVLFGDDYKRGALLVNLNREHREAGVDCRSELADNLPNVLRLIASMRDLDLRGELVEKIVAPALRKIIGEFGLDKVEAKNAIYKKHHRSLIDRPVHYGLIYQLPLIALNSVLESDFNAVRKEVTQGSAEFLQSISTEIMVEGQ